jgi:two-component system chemotaxis sensor kinase CheA
VRNAIDHGIESPSERLKQGKKEAGTLCISAYQSGGQRIIDISDDGRGMNRAKIETKAIEKGILNSTTARGLTDKEIFNILFEPGFSTAEKVSNVSGRGVGMDVVRTNIEGIGGKIDIESEERHGSLIRLRIPLTMAIVPALIVQLQECKFAIPQNKLAEVVRVDLTNHNTTSSVQFIHSQKVLKLRDTLIPLIFLKDLIFNNYPKENDANILNVAILQTEAALFGLVVDTIEDSTDIVIKPLTQVAKNLGFYSGATVLGDGDIALVLDINALSCFNRAQPISNSAIAVDLHNREQGSTISQGSKAVVARIASFGDIGIPLCHVDRLEEIDQKLIQHVGNEKVAIYRNGILPIIDLCHLLRQKDNQPPHSTIAESNSHRRLVIVQKESQDNARKYGLVVDEIVDIQNLSPDFSMSKRSGKALESQVILQNRILTVLNVPNIISSIELSTSKGRAS